MYAAELISPLETQQEYTLHPLLLNVIQYRPREPALEEGAKVFRCSGISFTTRKMQTRLRRIRAEEQVTALV
jgi:hypothetical protein